MGVAAVCNFPIDKGFSVPCIAHYCRAFHPGWGQWDRLRLAACCTALRSRLPSELAPGYRYVPWLRRDPLQPGVDGREAAEVEAPFMGDVIRFHNDGDAVTPDNHNDSLVESGCHVLILSLVAFLGVGFVCTFLGAL
jgi:hypothetical protein